MHFRGHSRRIALLLPPFVVYYKHRAVLCSICHSRNSYRAENRPVTANRAVFCFLRVRVVHRVVSAHLRGDSCPKPSKAGKTWYTGYNKSARLGGRLKRRESYAKRLISMVLALSMALTAMPLPALAQSASGGRFQSFSTPGHPAACHTAHSTSFSALESFFRAASRRRAVRLSAQRSR